MPSNTRWVIVALVASLALGGCGTRVAQWLSEPPTTPDQQAGIAIAIKAARAGCSRLALRALRTGEVRDLAVSLDYVAGLLAEDPTIDAERLTRDLAAASPDVAEFAPEIIGLTALAAAAIPGEQRQATYYVLIQGVIGQCRLALGTTG